MTFYIEQYGPKSFHSCILCSQNEQLNEPWDYAEGKDQQGNRVWLCTPAGMGMVILHCQSSTSTSDFTGSHWVKPVSDEQYIVIQV